MYARMPINFLICSERSGSNLITRLLNAHSQVCGPATTHLFRLLGENQHAYGDLTRDANWRALIVDCVDLLAATLGAWHDQWTAESLEVVWNQQRRSRNLAALLAFLYEQEALKSGKTQLFVKEIELFRFWSWLDEAFPDAKYIALVRDPRDMALSWKKSAAIRGGVMRAAQAWLRDQQAYQPIVERLRLQQRVFSLTYEQLISEPRPMLERIMEFLGLAFESCQLDYHRRDDTSQLARAAVDFANLERPIMSTNLGKYRTELSNDERAYVETLCRVPMLRLGYQVEGPAGDRVALEQSLAPQEPFRKPAYDHVTSNERSIRARWVHVVDRIRSRERGATPTMGSPGERV